MAPSVSYSITVRLEVASRGRAVSEITRAVEQSGGVVTALDVTAGRNDRLRVDVTCAARDTEHAEAIVTALGGIDGVTVHKVSDRTFLLHLGGKIEMRSKVPLRNRDDLSMAYTPGVGRVALAIAGNREDARRLTIKRNSVAVVTDGSAVLGLGNIGPYAALPVMEGKAALFKRFAGIDAWPICLDSQDTDEIVRAVQLIAPGFGGINLEDISAPRCFEVERRLRGLLDIPVFHDDQHGTAIVVMAALTNALRVVGKKLPEVRIAMAGAGAAGTAVLKLLLGAGANRRRRRGLRRQGSGAPGPGRAWTTACAGSRRTPTATATRATWPGRCGTPTCSSGCPRRASCPAATSRPWPATPSCSRWPTPIPRWTRRRPWSTPPWWRPAAATTPTRSTTCSPSPACSAACSTRRAGSVSDEMLLAAAQALADVVSPDEIGPHYIIPSVFHPDVASSVAVAVRDAATQNPDR